MKALRELQVLVEQVVEAFIIAGFLQLVSDWHCATADKMRSDRLRSFICLLPQIPHIILYACYVLHSTEIEV